ncbi:ectonucleotide pyrophosphatase/phosphodiesterase family member 7-like [Oncorhynchus masou masou]|uniref:ectonucleotide pyrophosphatase/phosphodiesterase family member 7-like n=1 Tax=Oncorhynchus masou masou TaxID=90313 RepID=UPI003183E91C
MVQQVDRTVGYIRDTTRNHGLSDRLNIIITADHGMTTVVRNGLVDEIILSKIPGFDFRDIKFQLVDYGPTGMLLPREGMLEKVYQALKGGHPHLHVYKKEDMPGRLHYSNHPRLLPLILFADQGYVINGFFPVQFNKGEHGYDNQMMDMKPFFRAVGPDFQKNLAVGPFETVNVYPLMCHLLGIKPEVNDGSLEVTRQMLVPKKDQGSYEMADSVIPACFKMATMVPVPKKANITSVIMKCFERSTDDAITITLHTDFLMGQHQVVKVGNNISTSLTLNTGAPQGKTKEMIVYLRKQQREHPIHIEGKAAEKVESFMFLGVHITDKLKWSTHTDSVVKKAP